jgi:hypothetical protein
MPQLIRFANGLIIKFYFMDHNPPHVHAQKDDMDGEFDIRTGEMIVGDLTAALQSQAKEWILSHSAQLMKVWNTQEVDNNEFS